MIKCKLLIHLGSGDSQFLLQALDPAAHAADPSCSCWALNWDLCRIFPQELLIPLRLGKLKLGKSNGFGMEG